MPNVVNTHVQQIVHQRRGARADVDNPSVRIQSGLLEQLNRNIQVRCKPTDLIGLLGAIHRLPVVGCVFGHGGPAYVNYFGNVQSNDIKARASVGASAGVYGSATV